MPKKGIGVNNPTIKMVERGMIEVFTFIHFNGNPFQPSFLVLVLTNKLYLFKLLKSNIMNLTKFEKNREERLNLK